jgi:hypothetical protein
MTRKTESLAITVRARAQGLRRIDEQLIEEDVGWRGV